MIGATLPIECSMNRWPPPGTMNSRLVGISIERMRALAGGTSGSSAPAITSVGCLSRCSQWMLVQPAPAASWYR